MSLLGNVQIFENEVAAEDNSNVLQARSTHQHTETGIVLGQRYIGESTSANQAIHSKEDSCDLMERKAAFTKLLKKTSLSVAAQPQRKPSSSASDASHQLEQGLHSAAWVEQLLDVERQLTVAEQQVQQGGTTTSSVNTNSSGSVVGSALLKLPSEEVLSDAEAILEDLHSSGPDRPKEIKRALEVLNEKLDVALQLAKRNRAACQQSIDTDVEVADDATATLLLVESSLPRAKSCTQSIGLLKQAALDWPALRKEYMANRATAATSDEGKTENTPVATEQAPTISEADLVALEKAVDAMEAEFEAHEADTLKKLDAFEVEFNSKFGVSMSEQPDAPVEIKESH